jgi:hypothetical protein
MKKCRIPIIWRNRVQKIILLPGSRRPALRCCEVGQKTPKSVNQFLNEEFDYVITLGRRAQSCDRKFPCAEVVHRKFDDPRGPDDPERQLREFRTIRDQILQRLRLFVLVHLRSQIPSRPTTLPMNAASG